MREIDFMKEVWKERDHSCVECDLPLPIFSPVFVSHILSKGAYPELRCEKKNVQIHCFDCHQEWEFGNKVNMKSYDPGLISELKLLSKEKYK